MNRAVIPLLSALVLCVRAQEPVTNRTDVVGQTLNHWVAEHSAAGFQALRYENRDGGHSPLPTDTYHGLVYLHPTEDDKKTGRDKGPAFMIRQEAMIGNCSMAGTADAIGSLGRACLADKQGQAFLFSQYLHNNLMVYPEHQDHDPGANGVGGGWGDMFPTNSPTVLVSQGSSLSDMPFVKALLATAASFSPEIQESLIRQHILVPTLQAIFRQSNKQVVTPEDYFTGKAHPPVFDGSQIDELKMITLAHTMSAQTVPPLAFVEVLSERSSVPGVDFFESPRIADEKLGSTPVDITRIFRGSAEEYTMTLSAGRSVDTQKRPLKYRWDLLQGNKDLVRIETADQGRKATLHVRWHPPMISAAGIRTHRVDIGLFVSNGINASAPAIVSFYMLPNERRFFDENGRLTEITYEAGNPELGLPQDLADLRWLALIEAAGIVDETLIFHRINDALSEKQRLAFSKVWMELAPLQQALDRLSADPKNKEQADKQRTALGKAIAAALAASAPDKKQKSITLREAAEAALNTIADRADLFIANQPALHSLAAKSRKTSAAGDMTSECQRLADCGVLARKGDTFATVNAPEHLTQADHYYLRQLHLTVLSQVLLPGTLERSTAPLFVDPRIGTRKPWRDVYRYDDKGARTGWDRFFQGKMPSFDAEGRLAGKDGKPSKVVYREEAGRLYFDVQGSKN